jgi:tRNA(Ile)-lysidine synthase
MRAGPRPPTGNLQDWARRVRYTLLTEAAKTAGFDAIVTAHHQDDQAETFLLRLARGSGVQGLAAMAEERSADGIRLIRPLLNIPRDALAEIAAASGLATVDDRSNRDPRFDRVRLRQLMPVLSEHGLSASRLSGTARQLRRAANALDHYAGACLAANFRADNFGTVSGPAAALSVVPEETALRALGLLCRAVGGAEYTPGLDRLETLYSAVSDAGPGGKLKLTLHGVAVEIASGVLTARREWGRVGLASVEAPGGASVLWDRRFRLPVPEHLGATHVGALGHSGRRFRSPQAGTSALRTLPGLYRGKMLLALPEGIEMADDGPLPGRIGAECVVGSRLGLNAVQLVCSP